MQIWHLSNRQGVMEKTCYLSATPPVKAISPYCSAPRRAVLSFACKLVCVCVRKSVHESAFTAPAYQ